MTIQQEMIQAVCDVCGIDWREVPRSSMGLIGRVAKELREVNASPEEVKRRAEMYSKRFDFGNGCAVLTPAALLKHWASLKPEAKQSNETEWERACRVARELEIEKFKGHPYETQEQFLERVRAAENKVISIKQAR